MKCSLCADMRFIIQAVGQLTMLASLFGNSNDSKIGLVSLT